MAAHDYPDFFLPAPLPATELPEPSDCGTDVLSAASTWLTGMLQSYASQSVTYERDGVQVSLCATLGSSLLKLDDGQGGVRMERTDADFIIPVTSFVAVGVVGDPRRGDKVYRVTGGKRLTYEVLPYGDEPPWRWSGQHRHRYRVHTKLIATEDA